MINIPIIDNGGGSVGEFEVAEELLVTKRGNQAVQDVVVAYRAGLRAGTASTLGKGQVAGSNRKPWRQKGLGRARAGYRQSPIWRGGSVVFGPKPRSYAKNISKQVAALAFSRVLSSRITEGAFKVVDNLGVKEGKTREVAKMMNDLKIKGKALLIVEKPDANLKRAARNIGRVAVCRACDINVYQMLSYPTLLASREAMNILIDRLKRNTGA